MPKPNTFKLLTELKGWEQNPRNISAKAFERLKNQIVRLGQYKPLLIKKDGTVLGGNMRLRAYKELGLKKAWVSIVEPKNEAEALEYSLSDNDQAGYYDADLLANLSSAFPDFNWKDYSVNLSEGMNLNDLISGDFNDKVFDEKELDEDNLDTQHECPKCGYEWS